MLSLDGAVRARAMGATRDLGAAVVRIQMSWRGALPGAPPADATDPGDPAYDWAPQDAAVRSAVAAGLTPLLTIAHAPPYAEAPRRWRFAAAGSWAPRPSELAAFATAVARRYAGTWPDPARPGMALPRVAAFQAWNEPNLPRYLSPQWIVRDGRWVPWAPGHYRRMLQAFAGAVRAVQPGATIVAAGLAPAGEDADGAGRMTPVRFLRALLCLGAPPGDGPVACPEKPDFDVLAFHPLSVGEPDRPARSSLDVSVADVGKMTAILRSAQDHHLLARRSPRLWITELNWSTGAIAAARRGAVVGRGLHRLWAAGAGLVTWQFLEDPARGHRAGLRVRGRRGPLTGGSKAYARGFALPVDVASVGRGRAAVWAVPSVDGVLRVEVRRGRRWRIVARVAQARRDHPGTGSGPCPCRRAAARRERRRRVGRARRALIWALMRRVGWRAVDVVCPSPASRRAGARRRRGPGGVWRGRRAGDDGHDRDDGTTTTADAKKPAAPAICGRLRTVVTGRLAAPEATEISGLVASTTQPGVLWAHNDSGDRARIFALRSDGSLIASLDVPGAEATDWEDIAVGPGGDLLLADIGDNKSVRNAIDIYRVPEPRLADGPTTTAAATRLRLTYPDGAARRRDAARRPAHGGDRDRHQAP